MKRMSTWIAALAIGGLLAMTQHVQAELKPGDPAPAFDLPGSDGKTYKLADFKDKQVVVIAWYPKAFTGG